MYMPSDSAISILNIHSTKVVTHAISDVWIRTSIAMYILCDGKILEPN